MLEVVLEKEEEASRIMRKIYQVERARRKKKEKDQWTWDMILGPGKLRSTPRSWGHFGSREITYQGKGTGL